MAQHQSISGAAAILAATKAAKAAQAAKPSQSDGPLPDGFQNVVQIGQADFIGLGIGADFGTGAFEVLNIRRMFIPKGEDRFQPTSKGIAIPAASPLGQLMLKALKDGKLL